uniref:nanos homolog 3-like n=1 Tax=Doryrhamphus excisus TaxID=161450 RepID=UPI0025AEAD50|nr:nanos homolog 3-like [Doryrhamphus excisus]
MEPGGARFQPWRDYFGLSDAVRRIVSRNPTTPDPPEQMIPSELDALLEKNDRQVNCVADDPTRCTRQFHIHAPGGDLLDVPAEGVLKAGQEQKQPKTPEPAPAHMLCRFCKRNGEPEVVYKSHWLKDLSGDVLCPVLWQYVCPLCGATGPKAHTKLHCPKVDKAYRSVYSKGRR